MTGSAAAPLNAILFLVGSQEPLRYGLTWRIWSAGTSFYIKTREPGLAETEVSLHGPDPRHARPGFKFGRDTSVVGPPAGVVNSGGPLPWWFSGKDDANNLTHAIRICVPADTLAAGGPNGGAPGTVRNRMFAGLLEVPPTGSSAMLDLYVSLGPPEFPNRLQLDKLDALHGPVVNAAGQNLSGVTRIVSDDRLDLSHLQTDMPVPESPADATRGVQVAIDGDGVLWLVERVLSKVWLSQGASVP